MRVIIHNNFPFILATQINKSEFNDKQSTIMTNTLPDNVNLTKCFLYKSICFKLLYQYKFHHEFTYILGKSICISTISYF